MQLFFFYCLNATRVERNLVMADSLNEKSQLKLSRNNWHGAFLPNIKSESRENENNIFHRSRISQKRDINKAICVTVVIINLL